MSETAIDQNKPRWNRTLLIVFVTMLSILITGFVINGRREKRRAAENRIRMSQNMRFLALAVQMYHDRYGSFPPAVVRDSNGEPLYSGRVLLLPFLEQQALYDEFDKTQPWDSYPNRRLTSRTPLFMRDSASTDKVEGQTDYLFVVGKGTIFEPPTTGSNASSMTDGSSNTICLVEVKDSGINWAEPRDLDFSESLKLPPGHYPGVNLAVFFDLHVAAIRNGISAESLRTAATCAGGEPASAIPETYMTHIPR